MISMNEKKLTRKKLVEDIRNLAKIFAEETGHPEKDITRNFYRSRSPLKGSYDGMFKDFTVFKKEALEITNDFVQDKKIFQLEEDNRKLKQDKNELLKKTMTDEKFLEI